MQHEYIFDASATGTFQPRFSYHEVYFLVITGLTETPTADQIVGHRVGNIGVLDKLPTDASAHTGGGRARLSTFRCSDEDLNTIYNTSMWTKSNLVTGGMSVDCPHRERLG